MHDVSSLNCYFVKLIFQAILLERSFGLSNFCFESHEIKAALVTDGPSGKCFSTSNTSDKHLGQCFEPRMFILEFVRSVAKYCSLCPTGGEENPALCRL